MKITHLRNGTTKITFSDSAPACRCGCKEGIHLVAAMAKSKCCDACTGSYEPITPKSTNTPTSTPTNAPKARAKAAGGAR